MWAYIIVQQVYQLPELLLPYLLLPTVPYYCYWFNYLLWLMLLFLLLLLLLHQLLQQHVPLLPLLSDSTAAMLLPKLQLLACCCYHCTTTVTATSVILISLYSFYSSSFTAFLGYWLNLALGPFHMWMKSVVYSHKIVHIKTIHRGCAFETEKLNDSHLFEDFPYHWRYVASYIINTNCDISILCPSPVH